MVVAVVVSHFKKRKVEPKVCGFTKGPFFACLMTQLFCTFEVLCAKK